MRPIQHVGVLAVAAVLGACIAPHKDGAHDTAKVSTATSNGSLAAPVADTLAERADRERVLGDPSAPLWVVMASDFQCPFCKQWHDSVMTQVVNTYVKTGRVRLAYLNFPLQQHRNAKPAAEAAMCAAAQGKFWSMHDSLFAEQLKWAEIPNAMALFDTLAARNGIRMTEWRACVSKHSLAALIQADHDRSAEAGVRSTPTFFIGGQRLDGAAPYPEFRAAIEAELAKISAKPPKPRG